jgi:hypothetical protein
MENAFEAITDNSKMNDLAYLACRKRRCKKVISKINIFDSYAHEI